MNKIKTIKIKNEDGSVSEESYSIAADALNIDMANGKNVQETIGTIDVDKDGDIAAQLNKKINKSDIIDNLNSSDNNKVLSAKQGKVLNEAVAAANLDIQKKMYYFNTIEDMKEADLQVGDTCQTLGYYSVNDGGAGLYKIVDDSNLVVDGSTVHILTNELKAELIHNGEINAETLGIAYLNDLNNIYNKFKKINFNKDYTLTESLTINNIILDFNNHTINGNVNLIYSIIAGENTTILNAKQYFQTVNTDYCNFLKITDSNVKIDGCNINGFRGITCDEVGKTIENITITNNIWNCKRYEILFHKAVFNDLIIENNKQTIPQNWEEPVRAENCIAIFNGFKWAPSQGEVTANILNTKYGKNYYINNNTFNQINLRAVEIVNAMNVKIENNYCYNLPGDKATTGISDDVFALEFCRYSNVSYNKVENSGENACDLLSSSYCNVSNNEFINCDGYSVDLNNADIYTRGWCDNTVTYELLESSNNIIANNIIGIKQVAVAIRNGRNNLVKNNKFYLESTHTDNVAVFLTKSEPFNTSIGTYGNTIIDNNFDNSIIRNYFSDSSLYINSDIVLGENDHILKYIDIDNSALTNNDDVKLYDLVFNLKAKNVKFYFIYDNKKYYFSPLTVQNTSYNAPFGISNVQFFDYRIYLFVYKHFLPLQLSNRVGNFYDVTSGRLYVELW